MTRRVDKDGIRYIVVEEEAPQQCDDCGKIAELRPYGPNGSLICYDCGQKDPAGTQQRFQQYVFGDDNDHDR